VSTGSACSSGSQKASHVVEAITPPNSKAGAVVRFGLGRWTTEEEIETAAARVVKVIRSLRATANV
jgi:cysteine desulfurase